MRASKLFYALAFLTMTVTAQNASAQSQPAPDLQSIVPPSKSLSGSYLAGRFAQRQQDWDAAHTYMSTVLNYDHNNSQMIQRTFLLSLGSGNFEKAKQLAERIIKSKDNTELALIFLSCDALSHDQYKTSMQYLDQLPAEGFGQYTKPLLTAWTLMGMGKKEQAIKILTQNTAPDDPTFHMHLGMIEEMTGNMAGAAKNYEITMANGLDLHTAVMVGTFFQRYGKPDVTHRIYESLDKVYPFNPFIGALSSQDPQKKLASNITRAADGAALALFDLATLLYSKHAYDSAQIYGSMVQLLDPHSPFAKLMMGDIAALNNRYDKAIDEYNSVTKETPIYWISRMREAEVFEISGQIDKSIDMLTTMSREKATRIQALVTLGDTYRRHDRYPEAITAYDEALADIAPVKAEHWPIIYARGIAKERAKRWDLAEKDLLQALSFQPDNPMILNFIAYSWADHGINLDKALEYAKQAATLRPHDGYILDSYGWTLFRLAKYQESIQWLEQAVEEVPNDSTLLDHLGDAYWQVGRQNEARYQWRHAGDLSHDASFKTIVQQKLQHGIIVPEQPEHQQAKL